MNRNLFDRVAFDQAHRPVAKRERRDIAEEGRLDDEGAEGKIARVGHYSQAAQASKPAFSSP